MLQWSRWLRAAAGGTAWIAVAALAQAAGAAPEEFSRAQASADAGRVVQWVRHSGDAQGRPFAVVDKRAARLYVFDGWGRLLGQSPALLGSTVGDHTVPGVGARTQSGQPGENERTTPAGRFESAPGRNLAGEHVVWVDYDSAFAIHRVRPGAAYKTRVQRLATPVADGKRLSWGCVVVPEAFYRQVVQSALGKARGVVYVLPETQPLQAFLDGLAAKNL